MALPLTLPAFALDATAYVQVTIYPDYYTARVDFYSGSLKMYSLTLIQAAPLQSLPSNLKIGDFVIQTGSLQLQIPSSIQPGTVTLNCIYTDPSVTTPTQLNAVIATWNLNQ